MGKKIIIVVIESRLTKIGIGIIPGQHRVETLLESAHDIGVVGMIAHPKSMAPSDGAEINTVPAAGTLFDQEIRAYHHELIEEQV